MSFAVPDISLTRAVAAAGVPQEVLLLAEKLKHKHGDVRIAREKHGFHIYIASPICLQRHGRMELDKKHLAINAEKYLGLGEWRRSKGTYNADSCALCMKTRTRYKISDLMLMPNLAARGIPTHDAFKVQVNDTSRALVKDTNGNMIPDVPGKTVPLSSLPPDHPAIQYLTGRGYDIPQLVSQMSVDFCVEEAPEDATKGRFYRRFNGGFRDTPQNRIIFYADIHGVRKGWQARYIEHVADNTRYVLHPYNNSWCAVAKKVDGKWEKLPPYGELDLSKYKTAFGAKRNEIVMGLDAAVRWNETFRRGKPYVCSLSEGPLDAGRVGPPGLAVLGKSLSDNQAKLIATHFKRTLIIADNDKAGQELKQNMIAQLSQYIQDMPVLVVPSPHKDIGDVPAAEALGMVGPYFYK
jgi:hypothetical protein